MECDGETISTRPCCANCQTPSPAGIAASRGELALAAPRQPLPDSSRGMTVQHILAEDAMVTAVVLTAQMFRLPPDTVVVMVTVGLPALSRLAALNPLLLGRLYAVSQEPLPEPITQFYARMAKSPVVRQAIMDDYRATYGGMLDPVNRAVGRQVGTTDGQAREVLAALLPAISQVLGRMNTGGKLEYSRRLHALGATGLPPSESGAAGAP